MKKRQKEYDSALKKAKPLELDSLSADEIEWIKKKMLELFAVERGCKRGKIPNSLVFIIGGVVDGTVAVTGSTIEFTVALHCGKYLVSDEPTQKRYRYTRRPRDLVDLGT